MARVKVKHGKRLWLVGIIIVILIVYVALVLGGSIPKIKPLDANQQFSFKAPSKGLAWPSYGQSAVGIGGSGVLASSGSQVAVPMASTAKLITALVVLENKPLNISEQGPIISLGPSDITIYNNYESENGSDMLISNGEQLSEYQMLVAMLLPSADNIADSLAIWAYGSLDNYKAAAQQYLKDNQLDATKVGADASGYDPGSATSAAELVRIGILAEANPVIAQIVAKPSASGFPLVGTINNVNQLLGTDDIIGIKTGNNNQDNGVFLSASTVNVNGQAVTVYTAVMGAPSLWQSMHSSLALVSSAQSNFSAPEELSSIKSGTIVGQYYVPWSKQTIDAVATQPESLSTWGGYSLSESISLKTIDDKAKSNQVVGSVSISSSLTKSNKTSDVILNGSPAKPSVGWMLFHPSQVIRL